MGEEGGFTSEGHPICAPDISALSTFRQHASEPSKWSSLIGAMLPALVKSHEGFSGRGAHRGEASGFRGDLPRCENCEMSHFWLAQAPPSPANATYVALPLTEAATDHSPFAAGAGILLGEQASGGREG